MSKTIRWVACILVMAVASSAFAAGPEQYLGFDLDLLAKALAHWTTFKSQYGEKEGNARFAAWLAERGQTRENYDAAWNLWWRRWKADPTGESEAHFHTLNSKYVNELNFADKPSQAQEKRGGVTLDDYARISVALSRPPLANDAAAIEKRLKEAGVPGGRKQWDEINAAWGAEFKADNTFTLTQQFSALYQKYAGPEFERQMEAATAKTLAEHNAMPPPPAPERPTPPTIESALARLSASEPRERWSGAREVLRLCDLWAGPGRRDPKDARAAHCSAAALRTTALPQVLDAIDHHGDDTLSYATNGLDFLADLGLKDPAVKAALERALERDRKRLADLEAQFAPIQDQAVPERMLLRPKLDGYQAAVRDIESALASW
jgi:hypothetical protein